MSRRIVGLGAAAAVLFSFGAASASSSACNSGFVPANPTGIRAANTGSPTDLDGSLHVCNNGAVVPPPAKGSATIGGAIDGTNSYGYVDVDGDSNNTVAGGPACTDGFSRVRINANGSVQFYNSPDGNYSDTDPGTPGSQPAQPKSAQQFAQDTEEDCG